MSLRVSVEPETSQYGHTSHCIWLRVPEAGNDGMLLGVVESRQAADEIAGMFQKLVQALPGLPKVVIPGTKR